MTQELIAMSSKELSRYDIIKDLIAGKINGAEAARQINLSVRQIRRLKRKVNNSGAQGLIHGSRGRAGNRKIPDETIEKAKDFLKKKYADFKPAFAAEKLEENYGIKLSKEKIRQIMIAEKLWQPKPRKKNKEHRYWRPRKEACGELEQFDGSYHDWLEGRAPVCCLLAAIDDGKGEITKASFTTDEDVVPVFSFWQDYVSQHGKPLEIYLDKHSTYKVNARRLLDDSSALTQFERAMRDLNIAVIHAHSPQAKGRIERLFGTLQDRLIKELRLANISTIDEANEFLEKVFIPKFNAKFAVVPRSKNNLHRVLNKVEKENLEQIFSFQDTRIVNNDFTISYESRWYQLDEIQPATICRKDKVKIEKRLDGKIFISLRNKYLNFKELEKRPEKIKMKVKFLTKAEPAWKPPIDHPWRKPFIFSPQYARQLKVEPINV
ncbi:ISNCY family transposase [Patescibacteria group bacterium]|nr:ISNCY family transposase [Patescibacteria group bacterium]MBU4511944.1 ISNCY family transposase [Patescibacteria group bacterium]MCG2693053.1 ISNCY family transposase [Candidatus Parcubacteria bacterium]